VVLSNGQIVISWYSQLGLTYQVFSTPDLSQPFTPLSGLIPSTGTTTSYTNSVTSGATRFFRVEQQ